MKLRRVIFLLTTLSIFCAISVAQAQVAQLDGAQKLWFEKRNKTILVRPEKNYPPFVFVSSGTTGKPQGLAVDYIELVAKKLAAKVQYFDATNLSSILDAVQSGKDGTVLALTDTTERSQYLYFTKPYITVPAVIVVRKDSSIKRGGFTLADFGGRRVAVGDSYGVESYIKDNYRKIIIEPVTDDEVGLQKLLLGEVDAAVMDLASLSYYTSNQALSYVVVGGQTGFDYNLSFAVPKSTPELQTILDTALASITPQERSIIKDKWITLNESVASQTFLQKVFNDNSVLIMISIVLGALLFLVGIILMVRALRKTQLLSIVGSRHFRHNQKTEELEHELDELKDASKAITDELQQIQKLEKDIAEKIQETSN